MKTLHILGIILITSGFATPINTANAAISIAQDCVTDTLPGAACDTYCKTSSRRIVCGTDYVYCDCTSCDDGSTPTEVTITPSTKYKSVTYHECPISFTPDPIVSCPTECPTTTWTDVSGTNYQTKCNGDFISPACIYQCKHGYYGTGQTCTQCPESTNVYTNAARTTRARGTSDAGTTSTDGCYLTPGTYYDVGGQFSIDTNECIY